MVKDTICGKFLRSPISPPPLGFYVIDKIASSGKLYKYAYKNTYIVFLFSYYFLNFFNQVLYGNNSVMVGRHLLVNFL